MKFDQIVRLPVTPQEVKEAIVQARRHRFIDNLRQRHPNVAFDSKLRGYVGEIALARWLLANGIEVDSRNEHRGSYRLDIDFRYRGLSLELKTSLVPDADGTMQRSFQKRDLKLIKRSEHIEDLEGDVHIQIYFDSLTRRKDEWLRRQQVDLNSNDADYLYEALCGRAYLDRTYLVGWMDKSSMIETIYTLPEDERTWGHARRKFWKCPLRHAYSPRSLPRFLGFYKERLF